MNKPDWNPDLYLRFNKERTQPSIDLVNRIEFEKPKKILDIGCGPGNSTQVLAKKWPGSKIVGVDKSPSMIEKAKRDYPDQEWFVHDVGRDALTGKFDIIFSNAAIHWIPDHASLLKNFYSLLMDHGLIAIQLPLVWDMPLGKSFARIEEDPKWAFAAKGVKDLFTIHNYAFYYEHLSELFDSIEIWETHYMQIMESHFSILEMMRSTRLKPYFERLKNEQVKKEFEEFVLEDIRNSYPPQKDGKVIFPFKRLFFIAKKK